MSIKSLLPAAAAVAVAALALAGCTQNNAAPAESSSSSAAPAASAPAGSADSSATPAPAAPSAAAPSAGAADTSAPITFDESNQHLTIPAGVTKVIVNNAIEGGSVADITVNGSNNDIHVEALTATAAFTGSNNTITFEKATNFKVTSDTGANNTIEGVE